MESIGDAGAATRLLIELGKGDGAARDEMLPLVYEELRRLARYYISRERPGHTLQPTALVHEAYLRLIDQRQVDWRNRAQFLGLAAGMMRRILVNHARDRAAAKRGGDGQKVSLRFADGPAERPGVDVLALNRALDRLASIDPRKGRVVELKFFGGLTTEEIGQVLDISVATVEREWSFARAWLYQDVEGGGPA
jgi:RNA polymerase sigma-70 factor, ECF subfamily